VVNVIDNSLLRTVFCATNEHFLMANLPFPSVDNFDLQVHLRGSSVLFVPGRYVRHVFSNRQIIAFV
jgi:hypothetical protein